MGVVPPQLRWGRLWQAHVWIHQFEEDHYTKAEESGWLESGIQKKGLYWTQTRYRQLLTVTGMVRGSHRMRMGGKARRSKGRQARFSWRGNCSLPSPHKGLSKSHLVEPGLQGVPWTLPWLHRMMERRVCCSRKERCSTDSCKSGTNN